MEVSTKGRSREDDDENEYDSNSKPLTVVEQLTLLRQSLHTMSWLLIVVSSYLIGSVPWGFILARVKGVDIRQKGSGNIGAANAARVMGKNWGYAVFLCDFLKGFLSVKLGQLIAGFFHVDPVLAGVLAATASVLGHDFPVWLGFKGGKGIATLAGVVLGLLPALVCVLFGVVWAVVFLLGRYTSLASISAVIALPIAAALIVARNAVGFPLLIGFCVFMAALALWKHRSNIVRLLTGTENRFGKKPRAEASEAATRK